MSLSCILEKKGQEVDMKILKAELRFVSVRKTAEEMEQNGR